MLLQMFHSFLLIKKTLLILIFASAFFFVLPSRQLSQVLLYLPWVPLDPLAPLVHPLREDLELHYHPKAEIGGRRQVEILSPLIKYKWKKHDAEACDLWPLSLCLHWGPCHLWTQGSHLHPMIHWGEVACNESYSMINGIITLSFVQRPSSLKSQFDVRMNGSPTFSPLLPFKPLTPSAPWEKVHQNTQKSIEQNHPWQTSQKLLTSQKNPWLPLLPETPHLKTMEWFIRVYWFSLDLKLLCYRPYIYFIPMVASMLRLPHEGNNEGKQKKQNKMWVWQNHVAFNENFILFLIFKKQTRLKWAAPATPTTLLYLTSLPSDKRYTLCC